MGCHDGGGIGSGLAQPDINGSALRRKSKYVVAADGEHAGDACSSGNPRLVELIPRFLRLSALVAVELGRELGEEIYGVLQPELVETRTADEASIPTPCSPSTMSPKRSHVSDVDPAPLSPSLEWYMLLGGLLTRAALEGYLTGGWRGADTAECLLSIGRGFNDNVEVSEEEDLGDSAFEWFDPDDLPGLKGATRILFPSLRRASGGAPLRPDNPEVLYHVEMEARIRRVSLFGFIMTGSYSLRLSVLRYSPADARSGYTHGRLGLALPCRAHRTSCPSFLRSRCEVARQA